MKKYILLLSLAAMMLGSCTNSEDPVAPTDESESTTTLEKGKSVLKITIKNKVLPDPATRAATIAATNDEKVINRLDFYVFPANGDMQRFENVKLTKLENGKLAAEFKILGNDASLGETRIVAIANPKTDLSKMKNYSDLQMLLTNELSDPSLTDFMMYWEEVSPALRDDIKNEIAVDLERLVARIDVINKANNKIFILQSARVLNAKVQSFVQPHYGYYAYEENVKDLAVCDYVVNKKIESRLYTYESGNNNDKATAVEIKGILRGEDFTKTVKFTKGDSGNPLRIERNTLYRINISGSEVDQDIKFEITVADWDNGDDIVAEIPSDTPDYVLTTLDGFTFDTATNALKADDPTEAVEKTQVITCTSSAEAGIRFDFAAEETSNWIYCDDALTTSIYKDGKVETTLTVKATPNKALTAIPVVVTLYNKADFTKQKTFTVQIEPAFGEVEVAGVTWATFNLGGRQAGDLGAMYQGGRPTAFSNSGAMPSFSVENAFIPIDQVEIGGIHEYQFICVVPIPNPGKYWEEGDISTWWLNTGTTDKGTKDPCPDGWRIPTDAEFNTLLAGANITYEPNGTMVATDKTSGNTVSFPAVGTRLIANGANNSKGFDGMNCYHSGDSGTHLYFIPTTSTVQTGSHGTAAGAAIRCVKMP